MFWIEKKRKKFCFYFCCTRFNCNFFFFLTSSFPNNETHKLNKYLTSKRRFLLYFLFRFFYHLSYSFQVNFFLSWKVSFAHSYTEWYLFPNVNVHHMYVFVPCLMMFTSKGAYTLRIDKYTHLLQINYCLLLSG